MNVTVREAVEADYAAICECHRQTEERIGCKMDLPSFADPAVLGWFVAVDEAGNILGGLYTERAIEEVHFGTNPLATAAIRQFLPAINAACWDAGLRTRFMFIPAALENADDLGRHAEHAGFEKRTDIVTYSLAIRRGV